MRAPLFARHGAAWLAAVGVAFIVAELTLAPLRARLGWDEITYIAQTSIHKSGVLLPPGHSRGVALIAAPVTLLTTDVTALRAWMAVLAGIGLFGALMTWYQLRPAWVLALAGVLFGALAVTRFNGVQVEADLWEALVALATAGVLAQWTVGRIRGGVGAPLLVAGAFLMVLVRIEDAAFILVPMLALVIVAPSWRNRNVIFSIVGGMILGMAEWVAEAYAWYGGPINRIHLAAQQPPGFTLTFSLPEQIRVLDGPAYCGPAVACHGWYPWMMAWWLGLLALAVLGVVAGRYATRELLGVCTLSVLAGYTFFVNFAAGRYFLPAFALAAIVAADGADLLITRWRPRIAIGLLSVFLLAEAATQQLVVSHEFTSLKVGAQSYATLASDLNRLGVRPPCAVKGVPSAPVSYYLGCIGNWNGDDLPSIPHQVLLAPLVPHNPAAWSRLVLEGAAGKVAYIRRIAPATAVPTAPPKHHHHHHHHRQDGRS